MSSRAPEEPLQKPANGNGVFDGGGRLLVRQLSQERPASRGGSLSSPSPQHQASPRPMTASPRPLQASPRPAQASPQPVLASPRPLASASPRPAQASPSPRPMQMQAMCASPRLQAAVQGRLPELPVRTSGGSTTSTELPPVSAAYWSQVAYRLNGLRPPMANGLPPQMAPAPAPPVAPAPSSADAAAAARLRTPQVIMGEQGGVRTMVWSCPEPSAPPAPLPAPPMYSEEQMVRLSVDSLLSLGQERRLSSTSSAHTPPHLSPTSSLTLSPSPRSPFHASVITSAASTVAPPPVSLPHDLSPTAGPCRAAPPSVGGAPVPDPAFGALDMSKFWGQTQVSECGGS